MTRYLPFYRYKKHLSLDVNVKNARVRARAGVSCVRYNAIPLCGGVRDYSRFLYPLCGPDSDFKSTGDRG
jgi:hypothetical protein